MKRFRTSLVSVESTAVCLETLRVRWFVLGLCLPWASVLTLSESALKIIDFGRSPFIFHFVLINQLVQFGITVHVNSTAVWVKVASAWGMRLSLLMMFFERSPRISHRSFGFDRSASTG